MSPKSHCRYMQGIISLSSETSGYSLFDKSQFIGVEKPRNPQRFIAVFCYIKLLKKRCPAGWVKNNYWASRSVNIRVKLVQIYRSWQPNMPWYCIGYRPLSHCDHLVIFPVWQWQFSFHKKKLKRYQTIFPSSLGLVYIDLNGRKIRWWILIPERFQRKKLKQWPLKKSLTP